MLRWIAVAIALTAGHADGQEIVPQVPVVTVDQDRLYSASLWAARVRERIRIESEALAAENRRIEAELVAEERDLTERRKTMDQAAFRKLAEAFDAKVVDIRQRQESKARAISRLQEIERQRFLAAALPVIETYLRERGALIVLDRRVVFAAVDAIDITDDLTARINASVGAGEDLPMDEIDIPADGRAEPDDASGGQ
ncbi:OmpH family outer membrane protein [Albidovulum inexpectatum]|uniref:OmpH family outer membrane protein n=1 Tax=Albidovulum inexpectatum TaxID=196587 RepID=UPI001473FB92|nr:OmpH family outer membrane protein [Albidovulum inexpectatum]